MSGFFLRFSKKAASGLGKFRGLFTAMERQLNPLRRFSGTDGWFIALLIAIPLFFFRALFLTGEPLRPGSDCYFLDFPFRLLAWESIRHGEIPFWNPYNSGGMNLLGQPFFFLIYPLYGLTYLFSKEKIFFVLSLVQILHIIIALLGMYFLLKKIVHNRSLSFWGSVLYGFSYPVLDAFAIGQLLVSYAFLPWIVWFLHDLQRRNIFFNMAGLSVLLFLLAGGCFPQWTVFAFFIVFLFLALNHNPFRKRQRKAWGYGLAVFFASLLLAFCLGAAEFIPFLEQNLQGARGNIQLMAPNTQQDWITPWFLSLRLLVPNLFKHDLQSFAHNSMVFLEDNFNSYYGIVPALLTFGAFFAVRKRRLWAWKAVFAAVFLIALGLPVVTQFFSLLIMKADLVHTRIGSFLPFAGVILAAAALRSILVSREKAFPAARFLALTGALLLAASLSFYFWGKPALGAELRGGFIVKQFLVAAAFVFPAASLLFLYGKGLFGRRLLLVFLIAMAFVDIACFSLAKNKRHLSVRPVHEYFELSRGEKILGDRLGGQKTDYRVHYASVRIGDVTHLTGGPYMHYFPNGNIYNKFYEANGYILNMPKDIGEFLTGERGGYFIRMADTLIHRSLPALLSIRYLVVGKDFDPYSFTPMNLRLDPSRPFKVVREFSEGSGDKEYDFKIIEMENIPPRFFFTKRTEPGLDRGQIFDRITRADFDPRETAYFEERVRGETFDTSGQRVEKVEVPSANRVLLKIRADKPGVLVANNFWHPWWQVKVDGVKKALHRVNFIFQAVEIPAGASTVSFYCEAASFKTGVLFSAAGLFILAGLLIAAFRNTALRPAISGLAAQSRKAFAAHCALGSFFVILALLYSWGGYTPVHGAMSPYGDYKFFYTSLAEGILPFWNPYSQSGMPYYVNYQLYGFLEPTNFLAVLAMKVFSWTPLAAYLFHQLLVYYIFVTGALHVLRFITGSPRTSLLFAFVFALAVFPNFMREGHAVSCFFLVPYMTFFLLRFFKQKSYRDLFAGGILLAISANLGVPGGIIFYFVLLAAGGFLLGIFRIPEITGRRGDLKRAARLLLLAVLMLLIAAPAFAVAWETVTGNEMLPSFRIFLNNGINLARVYGSDVPPYRLLDEWFTNRYKVSIPAANLAGLVIEPLQEYFSALSGSLGEFSEVRLYLGLLPLIFLAGIWGLRKQTPLWRYALLFSFLAVMLLGAMANFRTVAVAKPAFPQKLFGFVFPLFTASNFLERYGVLFLFCLVLLSALGFLTLNRQKNRLVFGLGALLAFFKAAVLSYACLFRYTGAVVRTKLVSPEVFCLDLVVFLMGAGVLLVFWPRFRKILFSVRFEPLRFCAMALIFLDLLMFGLAGKQIMSREISEHEILERESRPPASDDFTDYRTPFSYPGNYPWDRFFGYEASRREMAAFPYTLKVLLGRDPSADTGSDRHASPLKYDHFWMTRYFYDYLAHLPLKRQLHFSSVTSPMLNFYPKEKVLFLDQRYDVIAAMSGPSENGPEGNLYIESDPFFQGPPLKIKIFFNTELFVRYGPEDTAELLRSREVKRPANADIAVVEFDSNKLRALIDSPQDGYFYFADGYSRHWKAFVDGGRAKIEKTNINFKSVFLTAGVHAVTFVYDPVFFRFSLFLYVMGLFLATAILSFFGYRKWLVRREKTIRYL